MLRALRRDPGVAQADRRTTGTPGRAERRAGRCGGQQTRAGEDREAPAVYRPRQMVLPRPVDGVPLPQVDQESGIQDKLDLYRTLFAGRSDVYAYRWENAADGIKGWSPKRRPGTTRDNPEYLPLTDECHYGASDEGQLRRLRTLRDAGR